MRKSKISRTALILVGRVFAEYNFRDSVLYDPQHVHVLRPKKKIKN
jgi:precorrin-4/cobalt-precorrin-4 C11-methyltransferase